MPAIAVRAPAAAWSSLRSRSDRSSRSGCSTWLGLYFGYWISLLLVVPAAGFLVRLFMIQHDCGHGSFFRSKWLNDWIGRVLGVLTFTPYDFWRHTHAVHHASSGNLGAARHGRHRYAHRRANIWRCRGWGGCAIGSIAIRW